MLLLVARFSKHQDQACDRRYRPAKVERVDRSYGFNKTHEQYSEVDWVAGPPRILLNTVEI